MGTMNTVERYFEFFDVLGIIKFAVRAYNVEEARLAIEIALCKEAGSINWSDYGVRVYDIEWRNNQKG